MKIKRYLVMACVILGIMWVCVYSLSEPTPQLEAEEGIDLPPGILEAAEEDNIHIESNMTNRSHRMEVLLEDTASTFDPQI